MPEFQKSISHLTAVSDLVFRDVSRGDFQAIFDALRDEETSRWLAALSLPVTEQACSEYVEFLLDPDVCSCAIDTKGCLVGVISLGTELTFWIVQGYRQRGVATNALRVFLSSLEPVSPTRCIVASCMHDNLAAAIVLQKLGFEPKGEPFPRFSFAHRHACLFQRYEYCLPSVSDVSTNGTV